MTGWAHRLTVVAVVGCACLAFTVGAWAYGPVGADPAQNFPITLLPDVCDTQPDNSDCQNAVIYYLDQARASLGQPPYALPADFTSLPAVDQDLILTNVDRLLYGLPAIPGLTDALNADAATGVQDSGDPLPTIPGVAFYTSNWAGGYANEEQAYEAWMYDDGPGSSNIDCTPTDTSGCWGHRHDILWSFTGSGPLAMGAASGTNPAGFAMLAVQGTNSYTPVYSTTWSAAVADGAGTNTYLAPATVKVTVVANGYGTFSSPQATDNECGGGYCQFTVIQGSTLQLTATPGFGSVFGGWSNNCASSNPCTITAGSTDTTITANFTSQPAGSGGDGLGPPVSSGGSGSGAPGSSGSGSGGSGSGGSGAGSTARPYIASARTSLGTIQVALRGSGLVCALDRRSRHRWAQLRKARCATSVTYRHLGAGQYRVTVTADGRSVSRQVVVLAKPRTKKPLHHRVSRTASAR